MADFTFAHREEGFDNHIDKSIRGYKELLNDVVSFSSGEGAESFIKKNKPSNK